MVGWVGLRGAVPIVLATFPLVEGVRHADVIFNVVFFVVLTSVLVQGTTIPVVARWLRVDVPLEQRRPHLMEMVESGNGAADLHELTIPDGSRSAGRQLVDLRLPPGVLVVLISRGETFLVPQGSTVLEPGDGVLVVADEVVLAEARALLTEEPEAV